MTEISKSALVPHQATDMLALVNDIEKYPEFLQWCRTGFIDDQFADGYTAGMVIRIKGVQVEFATENTITHHEDHIRMAMTLVKGPFRKLHGQWLFTPYPEQGSKVELQLKYEVRSRLLGRVFAKGFDQVAAQLVGDFVARAGVVYGTN
ncbi:type II toxin-antitoxin system RatA family toxin [Marinicella meishanensis]|uniref:type II toxin-antitoxin system RatA family toxin n=1 Tax=Marinicella meishanensis TaxID=2873263 RepID=UPI001CC0281C|nr:type II toxin-antitoxin system RatA family toxin [Marinicella sp. NBU2979]